MYYPELIDLDNSAVFADSVEVSLHLHFNTDIKEEYVIIVPDPSETLTDEQFKALALLIIDYDVFAPFGSSLTELLYLEKVETQTHIIT